MASCDYHPNRDVVSICMHCGRSICTECKVELNEKIYCNPCADNIYTSKVQGDAAVQENTSGLGSSAIVPQEVQGWNWGAFFLDWIWAIGNKAWIGVFLGLFAVIIYIVATQFNSEWVGWLTSIVISVVLALKGSEWAWQNKRWDSIEHFKRTQKKWRNWGIMAAIVSFVISITISLSGYNPQPPV